jgi:hypothetical protein
VLRQALGQGVGFTWAPNGRIVFTTAMPSTGLQEVSADGGDPKTLLSVKAPAEQDFHDVFALPDDKGLLYVIDRGQGVSDTLAVLSNGVSKEIHRLQGESLRLPIHASTGHILYARSTPNPGIWALPFSIDTLRSPESRSSSPLRGRSRAFRRMARCCSPDRRGPTCASWSGSIAVAGSKGRLANRSAA